MIKIEQMAPELWRVTVDDSTSTTHEVLVPDAYYRRLTGGECSVETLLGKSFEFLLAREPNTSILRQFELPVISRYFPEYEATIKKDIE